MAANGFTTQNVNYHITADGGFAWTVNYDLSFLSSVFLATIRIKLIGDTASASVRTTWETGIETIWDNKVFFSDGAQLYAVQINADFVSSGQNQTVTVHDSSGRYNMTNWYTTPEGGASPISTRLPHTNSGTCSATTMSMPEAQLTTGSLRPAR
jgi:hypothetical protein